jgi:hypothetical protein
MPKISASTNIDSVQLEQQSSAPTTPASGYWRVYCKSAGAFIITNAGVERQLAEVGLDGSDASNVADDQATPGLPIIFSIAIAGGEADDKDITIAQKVRVIDVWCQHTGGAGEASDTIQVKNEADAITDAMDWSGADNVVVRAGEIDDAYATIDASGTLRVTTTDDDAGDDVGAGIVYVLCIPVT